MSWFLSKIRDLFTGKSRMVPICCLSRAALRQVLLGHHLAPGDYVFDATANGEFTEILEFLGMNVVAPNEISGTDQSGRLRLVLARPEDRSPLELSRAAAEWLSRLRPGGTLVLIDAGRPDVLSGFPGICRRWSTDGTTLAALTISSLVRAATEWHTFALPAAPAATMPAA